MLLTRAQKHRNLAIDNHVDLLERTGIHLGTAAGQELRQTSQQSLRTTHQNPANEDRTYRNDRFVGARICKTRNFHNGLFLILTAGEIYSADPFQCGSYRWGPQSRPDERCSHRLSSIATERPRTSSLPSDLVYITTDILETADSIRQDNVVEGSHSGSPRSPCALFQLHTRHRHREAGLQEHPGREAQ